MDRWIGKVALITGASGGIGIDITKKLAEKGMKVICIARRLEKLEELAASAKAECKAEIYPMMCDVRKEEDILKVFKWAEDNLGGVDVLINNAGVLKNDAIIDGSTDNFRTIMDVNVIAAAICSREFVQSVKKRNTYGQLININSVAGHFARSITIPFNLYCASKYAITGMTHSLQNELFNAQLDIKITSISPGVVDTPMIDNSTLSDYLKQLKMLRPQDVTDAVVYVLSVSVGAMVEELILTPHGSTLNSTLI